MVFLFGGVIGVVALYFWLIGHWFARVVTFPLLAIIMALVGALVIGNIGNSEKASIFGAIVGIALAWPISSIPIYYRRRYCGPGNQSLSMSFRATE